MASPKVVRSQPFSASIGSWKKPIAERGPKVIAAIRHPHAMISQGVADAVLEGAAIVMGAALVGRQQFIPAGQADKRIDLSLASISLMFLPE
jgi:hypothetical protein